MTKTASIKNAQNISKPQLEFLPYLYTDIDFEPIGMDLCDLHQEKHIVIVIEFLRQYLITLISSAMFMPQLLQLKEDSKK